MVKLCGRCDQLVLDHPNYRYNEAFYPCLKYFKEEDYKVGKEMKHRIIYKMCRAHDKCLGEVMEDVELTKEEIIPPPEPDPIPESIPELEAPLATEEAFVPPDPIKEIIEEPIPLTSEEKKAIKIQQLQAKIDDLEMHHDE